MHIIGKNTVAIIVVILVFGAMPNSTYAASVIFDAVSIIDAQQDVGWTLDGNLAGSAKGGNISKYDAELGVSWIRKFDDWAILAAGSGGFGVLEKSTFDKQVLAHGRTRWYINDIFSLEGYVQYSANEVLRIGMRTLVGVGPRLTILQDAIRTIAVGVLPSFEAQRIWPTGEADDQMREHVARLASYINMRFSVTDVFSFELITYVQPRVDQFSDWRLASSGGMGVEINDFMSLNIGGSVNYDATPALTVGTLDWKTKAGISLALSRP